MGSMLLTWLSMVVFTNAILAIARLVNTTVDDHDPSIQYAPVENHWLSLDQDCSTCATAPDPSQVYNRTWHDATYNFSNPLQSAPQSLVFRFNGWFLSSVYVLRLLTSDRQGSAIYAYGVLSSRADQSTHLLFYLDNEPAGNFTYTGPDTDPSGVSYTYDALFYSNTSLRLGEHAFELQNGEGDGGATSLILFDYLIYTSYVTSPWTP